MAVYTLLEQNAIELAVDMIHNIECNNRDLDDHNVGHWIKIEEFLSVLSATNPKVYEGVNAIIDIKNKLTFDQRSLLRMLGTGVLRD
jgi:hypothetical protein